jgi:hypothetical protein
MVNEKRCRTKKERQRQRQGRREQFQRAFTSEFCTEESPPKDCGSPKRIEFSSLNARTVSSDFEGGQITSDGGVTLLAEVDRMYRVIERLADCFTDYRDAENTEHPVLDLLRQRIYALCCGYEDLIDHDRLRYDTLLAAAIGKTDPEGQDRRREADRGVSLAGKSTLNRLELGKAGDNADSDYHKIVADLEAMENLLVDLFVEAHDVPPAEIILDMDPTDSPVYGEQWGRHFQGYYDEYCFLPLYVFCGDFLLGARLRPGDVDATSGAVAMLEKLVTRIRLHWPQVKIMFRADGAFSVEALMGWCERHHVEYVIGLASNSRLLSNLEQEQRDMAAASAATSEPERTYRDLEYRTVDSWSRTRRVAAKVEHLPGDVGETVSVQKVAEMARQAESLERQAAEAEQAAAAAEQGAAAAATALEEDEAAIAAKASARRGRNEQARAARAAAKQMAESAKEARRRARQAKRSAATSQKQAEKLRDQASRARRQADWAAEQSTWQGKSNVRFVVTNAVATAISAQTVYEKGYCPRGDMENRIKEQQLYLFADCLPCEQMRSNQIRLYFSSFAYVLDMLLRRDGLSGTEMSRAQCHTIRERLLKIGGLVKVTVRRVWLHLSSSYPYRELFSRVAENLRRRAAILSGLAHRSPPLPSG